MKSEINERIEKIKNGDVPDGYKREKKYIIPQNWKLLRLGDIEIKIGSGKTPRGGEKTYQKDGIPFIRSQNVLFYKLDMSTISFISRDIHEEMKSTRVLPNDVLLNITGASIGRSCIVPENFEEGNLNQHVCIIRTKDSLSNKYLVNVLASDIGQDQIMLYQAGGNRQGLNFEQIRNLRIPISDITEQEKIATILSTWDKAIELKEQLIKDKKKQKKGLMKNLLSGEVRHPGFDGEWKEVELGSIIKEIHEKTTENNQYPILTSSRKGIFLQEDYFKKSVASLDNTGYKIVRKGQFTYRTMSDDGSFKFNQLTEYNVGIVSPAYVVFEATKINDIFLKNLMDNSSFNKHIQKETQGGTRLSLKYNAMKQFVLYIPEINEQKEIAQILSVSDKEINLLEEELDSIKRQKKGLMQLLLTGIVRVLN